MTPYERDTKMWCIMVEELADIRASLSTVTDLLRLQLTHAGVSEEKIDDAIKARAGHLLKAQAHAQTLVQMIMRE